MYHLGLSCIHQVSRLYTSPFKNTEKNTKLLKIHSLSILNEVQSHTHTHTGDLCHSCFIMYALNKD